MSGPGRRVVLARPWPEAGSTPDHTVHLVALPLGEHQGAVHGLCGVRLNPEQLETVAPGEGVWCTLCFTVHVTGEPVAGDGVAEASTAARAAAALAYRELGWPVTLRGQQISLNLDRDLDAVALVIPSWLAAEVAEVLTGRRCPPAVLVHPALPRHRVLLAGERFGVPLAWPAGVHQVTGSLLLPPTATGHGVLRWLHPPRPDALKLCREFEVCAALNAVWHQPPPAGPTHF